MKILYIATSFPEPEKGATIYTDLAEELYNDGHQITVVVSEQTRNLSHNRLKKERGVDVLRVVVGNYYDVNFIAKGIVMVLLPFRMKRGISKFFKNKNFDLILFEAPPVTNAGIVSWAKKKFGCSSFLMMKDIFPQNAVDLGLMKKKSIIYNYFKKKEKDLYHSADIIGCMSKANRNYILKHNKELDSDNIVLFPNTKRVINKTVDDELLSDNSTLREKYEIPLNACVFLFGGNMGRPQYIDLLVDAIVNLREDKAIYFMFVGRGTDRHLLEEAIVSHNIKNAKVVPNLPRDEYEKITELADVGIIVLDPRFTIPNYPSRILSYMEYAKPVLAATDMATDIRETINDAKCGRWIHSKDHDGFIEQIRAMASSDNLKELGMNGRTYLEEQFSIKDSVKFFERFDNR